MKLAERVKTLETLNRQLCESHDRMVALFNTLVAAHNDHTHPIEWPQVMTLVLGPRCTPVNLKAEPK